MSESINTNPFPVSRQDKARGKDYVDFHKEPLAKVADTTGNTYKNKLIELIRIGYYPGDIAHLRDTIDARRGYCEARLRAAEDTKNKKERDEKLKWERELNYSEIALKVILGERQDKEILKSVTAAITKEITNLDRQLYTDRKEAPLMTMGETMFNERLEKIQAIANTFTPPEKIFNQARKT